jgi:hypothetical protein
MHSNLCQLAAFAWFSLTTASKVVHNRGPHNVDILADLTAAPTKSFARTQKKTLNNPHNIRRNLSSPNP